MHNTFRQYNVSALTIGLRASQDSAMSLRAEQITDNGEDGIVLFDGSTVTIGLDESATSTIARNEGAGLRVSDDGSLATLNSDRLVFAANGSGDIVDPFVDVSR